MTIMFKSFDCDSGRIIKTIKIISVILLFISFTLSLLDIPLWDYDFWWHIATGRYIVSEKHLPEKDIFSYTSNIKENANRFPRWEKFVLKQYWLSQIIFYIIFNYAGPKGIIILRTALLIATLLLVFWQLKRYSVSFPLSFIFIFMLFSGFMSSTGERPVLFTILFTAMTFIILEGFKVNRSKNILFLIPLMLLWSNMHGGYIIGVIIILVYMCGEGFEFILKRSSYTEKQIILFYSVTLVAAGITYINPSGWDAFSISMNISSTYKEIHTGIQEYQAPFSMYIAKTYPVNYPFVILVVLFLIILLFRNKKIQITHLILLLGTIIMSLFARRFIVYYMILATAILGRESDILIKNLFNNFFNEETGNKIMKGFTIVSTFSIILYVAGIHTFSGFNLDIAKRYSVPEAAVNFIEQNNLSGNMFNDYAYGGYLSWRLYPKQKTFIDSRALNVTVRTEYSWIMSAYKFNNIDRDFQPTSGPELWESLLNHYKINYIIIPPFDYKFSVYSIIFELTESENWAAVYCDPISLVFVKNNKQNSSIIEKHRVSKDIIYLNLIYRGAKYALSNRVNPYSLISMGKIFEKMGKTDDALSAYKYALERMPDNQEIHYLIDQLDSGKKSGSQ